MNKKIEVKAANSSLLHRWFTFDCLKWLVVIAFIAVAVVGNHYFAAQSILYRVLGVLVAALIAIMVAVQTSKGRSFLKMLKEAYLEIRKVVWPTRQETGQTTIIVVVVVLVMALLLWGMDSFLGWLISFIVG